MSASISRADDASIGDLAVNILPIAAWFGLITGLVEGTVFLTVQKLIWSKQVSIEIVWISAFFDLLAFSILGLALAALSRFVSGLPLMLVSVFLFIFLAVLDWLTVALTKHILPYSILTLAVGLAVALTRWFRNHEAASLRFWHRSLPWVGAGALLALVGIQGGIWIRERVATASLPKASSESPNILVIVVDALRADHLSSYGYARVTSPNVDRIAQQGVLFENAFPTSSWTLPSHASLLTGRYVYEHRVGWETENVLTNSPYPTLAEALRSRGYRTGGFSGNLFWFTRDRGFDHGFIHFEDYFQSVADMVLRTLYGRLIESFVLRPLGFEDIPARKRASDINRALLRWIDRDREKPFFVFLNYMDVHDPYLPLQPYRNRFSKLKSPGGIVNWRVGRSQPKMTQQQLQGEIDAYDGAIAYVDEQISLLIAELQRRGVDDHTLIIITSDHGESFGEHGFYLHANSLYREEIHVPLILRWPGKVPAGVRVSQPVTNAALPITVMGLIGASDQELFPRQSLRRLWETQNGHHAWPYPLVEVEEIPWAPEKAPVSQGAMRSLVSPQWHYIVPEKLEPEVYDWKNDPREIHNLADTPGMRYEVARLLKQVP